MVEQSFKATAKFKNAQLLLSAIIVFGVALIYGFNPSKLMPIVFGFEVNHLEQKNIFRAIMGLYMAFAMYWIAGILMSKHFIGATLSNVIFMAGLVFGRLMSSIFDGISTPYTIGLVLELFVMVWGIFNLKRYSQKS